MFHTTYEFQLKIATNKICFVANCILAKVNEDIKGQQFKETSDLLTKQLLIKGNLENKAIYIGRSPIGYPIVIPMCSKKICNLEASYSRRYPYLLNIFFSNDCLIGVDIEVQTDQYNDSLKSSFSLNERKLTQLVSPLILWSAKEALSKFFRIGLVSLMEIFEINSVTYKENYYIVTFNKFPNIICYVIEFKELFISLCLSKDFVIKNLNSLIQEFRRYEIKNNTVKI